MAKKSAGRPLPTVNIRTIYKRQTHPSTRGTGGQATKLARRIQPPQPKSRRLGGK